MDLEWFRMSDVKRKRFDTSVWIPLRSSAPSQSGTHSMLGFEEEFFGSSTVAVPIANRTEAEALGWDTVGLGRDNVPSTEKGRYVPSDVFEDNRASFKGTALVLSQRVNRAEKRQWHLHQDFVIALGLIREGDLWLAMDEGYDVVARIKRDHDGEPTLLEVKASHLKDYLCARAMALYVSSYRSRVRVVAPDESVPWLVKKEEEEQGLDRWLGRAYLIHEGGMPFGEETAVFHASRTDIPEDEDVPVLGNPNESNIASTSWRVRDRGSKLLRVSGEFWRREWVEPGASSPRIRRDTTEPDIHFIVDAAGEQKPARSLRDSGRWLWFKPDVIMALAHRRGGHLGWYTRDTGAVSASPDYDVHFGVNDLGLVIVYAKDVAYLPTWQQRIWAGHNVVPEGGISSELYASQVAAEPADTLAPEAYIQRALDALDAAVRKRFGVNIVGHRDTHREILPRVHRFRAIDAAGLYALAKDVARLTADSLDVSALQTIVKPPKGERLGSLKSLEKVVASVATPEFARETLGPLVAAYELRHGDAHLATNLRDALSLARIDTSKPTVVQGRQLLDRCVRALYALSDAIASGNATAAPSE